MRDIAKYSNVQNYVIKEKTLAFSHCLQMYSRNMAGGVTT